MQIKHAMHVSVVVKHALTPPVPRSALRAILSMLRKQSAQWIHVMLVVQIAMRVLIRMSALLVQQLTKHNWTPVRLALLVVRRAQQMDISAHFAKMDITS
jgi:hypothetical protein